MSCALRPRGHWLLVAALLMSFGAAAAAQTPIAPVQPLPEQAPPPAAGRVVATITVLEGTVRMPGVEVELRAAADETGPREDDE